MLKSLRNISMMSRGLRYKLGIAFFLMSLIPLFVFMFFILAYIYPETRYPFTIGSTPTVIIIVITLFITLLGFFLLREIVDPVLTIARQAKEVAQGAMDTSFEIGREDEIGDLSDSLNKMTSRIRDTINELRIYGEKTKEINIEIHRKVLTLSNLLQIGNLISAGASLEEVVKEVSEKLGQLEIAASSFIYLQDSPKVLSLQVAYQLSEKTLPSRIMFGETLLGELAGQGESLIYDSTTRGGVGLKEFKYNLKLENLAVFPVTSRGSVVGLLGTGNTLQHFKYKPEDLETLKVFVKQVSLAYENDLLSKRAKELEVRDDLTGLYNEKFTHQRLDEEIKRAIHYQRPCSLILVDVDNFEGVEERHQGNLLKLVARELEGFMTDADRAARLERDRFALIVPERNKREATQLAETLRRRMEEKGRGFHGTSVTVSAGVAENPIDGSSAEELLQKAQDALASAKSLGKNRVGT